MKKLNILIISRIIFPKNSPRAFRTTELAVELARQGHNVTVYAVLGKYDYSNFQKETGVKICNIEKMNFATEDSDGNWRYTLLDKILYHSLHRLIEFPDIELMCRIPGIIKKNKERYDLLITVAFPFVIHWGATLAKKLLPENRFPKVWVSDCGDPYMCNPIEKGKFFYFKYIEKWWGRSTDYISIPLEEAKNGYYKEFHEKIKVIPQGFNFSNIKTDGLFVKNEIPIFAYAGSVIPGYRDPQIFLKFLTSLKHDFKFVVFSYNNDYYAPFKLFLKEKLEIKPYIPREQLIYELSKMDFLINFKNQSKIQMPSKIIDYLLTKRPIIEISLSFPVSEKEIFKEFINGIYDKRLTGIELEQFDIKNVAQQFVELYYQKVKNKIIKG